MDPLQVCENDIVQNFNEHVKTLVNTKLKGKPVEEETVLRQIAKWKVGIDQDVIRKSLREQNLVCTSSGFVLPW